MRSVLKEIPAIKVDQILIFGNIQITTQAMKFCLDENIPIILLSSRGRFAGSVESFKWTNPSIHKKQFELADDKTKSLEIGKSIVKTKVINSKVVIQRFGRKRKNLSLDLDIKRINALLKKIRSVSSQEELMGIE